ncbi:hypothetical protein L1887_05445 [Cichorium endivia]|nr:hypothetical protein L1887_05445 [Cichorium endivia]
MDKMEITYNEKTKSLNSILSKYDKVFHAHTSDIKRANEKIMSDCEKFLQDYKESCLQIEARSKFLEHRDHELRKKEQKLLKEKKKLELKKRMRERLLSCKQLVNECYSSRKVAVGLKKELDMLHKRRTELEDQLKPESFASLQSEIILLENALHVIEDDDCIDLHKKLKSLQRELIEKGEQLQDLKNWSKALSLTIDGKNNELQDARQELIDGLKTYNPYSACIDIKTIGELNLMPFYAGCHSTKKARKNATDFYLECRSLVQDRYWHPFTVGLDKKEIINEEDDKIVWLKAKCSELQYQAVVRALNERNEYNPDCMQELWLCKEDRKASLKEGIDYIMQEWKTKIHKQPPMY